MARGFGLWTGPKLLKIPRQTGTWVQREPIEITGEVADRRLLIAEGDGLESGIFATLVSTPSGNGWA